MNETSENYLKLIFTLQDRTLKSIKPSNLSRSFQVSPAAVSDMLKRLAEDQFVVYQPYKGVRLTAKGRAIGQNMVRRHRIWEMYLHQVLKMPWDQVHAEAEALEHASSDDLINQLEEALGFPKFDPHGDPIPSKDGNIPTQESLVSLSACTAGDIHQVLRVSDRDSRFLHYLNEIGIGLNTILRILETRDFDGSVVVRFGDKTETLSAYSATHIFVKDTR